MVSSAPYTPRHNSKVERSYRRDNSCLHSLKHFESFEDFQQKLAARNSFYNEFPMRPLDFKYPVQLLSLFL